MKLNKRRVLKSAIASVGVLALLVGCSGNDKAVNTSADDGVVKLTALYVKHPLTKDFNDMEWLKEVEEASNVSIEWQQISADWDQKKAPMFASGDIPDLLFTATSDSDYATYPGLFQELSELIESDAPNIQRMFEERPETKVLASQQDGSIYATPKYQRYWPKTNSSMYINQQWLDNLGLDMPTTWDELYDVLIAFVTEDANGNGDPNDEIAMDFHGWGAYSPQLLLGSMGIQLTDAVTNGYFAEDGQVKNFFVDERYKELVIFMNKLYQAGAINPEAFTQDYSTFQSIARGEGDTAKVGFTWGWEITDRVGLNIADQYVTINQFKYDENSTDLRWSYDFNALNYAPNRVAMSAACENKEAAMRFIDAFYDPVVSMQVLYGGISDGNIQDNGDGSYSVLPPQDETIDPGTWKWTTTFADGGPIYLPDNFEMTLSVDMETANAEKAVYDDLLDKVDPQKDMYSQMYMKYTQEELNTLAFNQANIDNITETKWATWVTAGGVEEEWEEYVDTVLQAGLSQNLEIRQKSYEEYLSGLK